VEAARAGAAGAGFSVVAEEVRNLARSSAEAAQQTEHLIQESVEKTKQGYQISEHAAQALGNTVSEAHRIHAVLDEIAANSRSQNEGIEQITRALTYIGDIGQKSAKDAAKTHKVAETLRSRSKSVEQIIVELVGLVGTSR
jgi:methyl-accepting chemotaxis protein